MVLQRLLRAGEGKMLRRLKAIAEAVNNVEEDFLAMSDAELRAETDVFKQRLADGETVDDLLVEAFAVAREAARRTLGQRHFDVQVMGGAALHMGNISEMRTGEGKTLTCVLPAYLNALEGKGVHVVTVNDYLARRDAEWMGRVHRFLGLSVGVILANERPEVRRGVVRLRHHLRHEQRVRLRLPARQHGVERRRAGAARPPLRDRRRGRLDPHRRGPHAADHQRPVRPGHQVVRRVRPHHPAPGEGRRLRGRREEAHRRDHRVGRREGRGPARHRQPLRVGQHLAGGLPQQRPEGARALPQGQGVRRHGRRGAHRRRAHRPRARRPPLQRGHAPGDRGQGGGGDQGREPDARHDHPPELLPPVLQARRHDRHRRHRGRGVQPDLQARRRRDPDQPRPAARRRARRRLQERAGQVRRGRRGHRREARGRASRCSSARSRSRRASTSRSCCASAASRTRCSTPSSTSARRRSSRRPAARAPSPSPPTWPAAAPTSCSGGNPEHIAADELRSRGPVAGRDARGVREGLARGARAGDASVKARARRGRRRRRPVRPRHRAPRVAPHRQPAARPLRPAGRPGPVPLLPLARRRPHAPVQRRRRRDDHGPAEHPGRRPDRVQDGQPRDPVGPDAGRGAELRDPQERPQVRRGAQPPAHRHLRRASQGAQRRRPARADRHDGRRRHRGLRLRRDRRGLPGRLGPRAALDGAAHAVPRSASRSSSTTRTAPA